MISIFTRATAVVIGVLLALLAGSMVVTSLDQGLYRQRAAEAIESGTLGTTAFAPFAGAEQIYRYHHNDCLILSMLTLQQRGTPLQNAVSPLMATGEYAPPPKSLPQHFLCTNLVRSLENPRVETIYYHRYIHGDWVIGRLLMAFMSFHAATALLFLLALLVPAALALVAGRRFMDGERQGRHRDAAYAAMGAGILLFSGLNTFGWSLSFAPADITLSGFLLYTYFRPLTRMSDKHFATVVALLACLTAAFEFLIGSTPAAVAVLFAALAFEEGAERSQLFRRAVLGTICFGFAFVLSFLLKAAAVAFAWNMGEVFQAGAHLSEWARTDRWDVAPENLERLGQFGVTPEFFKEWRIGALAFAFGKMIVFSDIIGYGSRVLGSLIIGAGPITFVIAAVIGFFRARSQPAKTMALMLLLSAASVLGWYAVFTSHTVVHAYFMFRPLTWLTIFLCGLIGWRFGGPRATQPKAVEAAA